jgi:alpha-amylase/alpha-mannosidase (GH57 family)
MTAKNKVPLNVVLYWHMHQPEYRDLRNGEYHLPWTYLHTIKDYVDMVAHLEECEAARAVVNFAPVLLEQIDDYRQQLHDYLHQDKALRDPLLAALAGPVLPSDPDSRLRIMKECLRANEQRLIARYKPFTKLAVMATSAINDPGLLMYHADQFLSDLLVWYHLSWIGETVRRRNPLVKTLIKKAHQFTIHDRRQLIELIYELMSGVIGRYKYLYEQGRIELSMTPYGHPIVPLLIDIKSAEQAIDDVTLPLATEYPGGYERSQWHVRKGIEVFKKFFGSAPQGCWPSEGSISAETINLFSDEGIKWLASGETVLRNSLAKSSLSADNCIHKPYSFRDTNPACFFRDDGLSDLIGFKYSNWHADDAVANLTTHLESIREACAEKPEAIVSIILDGENAWEYYPENGYHFLNSLYSKLSTNENIKLTTFSEYLNSFKTKTNLKEIVSGSWVYGTFSTWIGEKDKNHAWDMLVSAKKVFDKVIDSGSLSEEAKQLAIMQLATCESSDWFWWFGEYNSAESVAAFDEQFRMHLSNLYQLLDVEPPDYLSSAFSFGSGMPAMGGAMLPGKHA